MKPFNSLRFKQLWLIVIWLLGVVSIGWSQNVTVEKSETRYEILSPMKMLIHQHRRLIIHNENGLPVADFFEATDKSTKLTHLSYHIYDGTGKKVKEYKKVDAINASLSGRSDISDARAYYIHPFYQNYPFTAEITYTMEYEGFVHIPDWMPTRHFHTSVKSAQLTIEFPKDYELRILERNIRRADSTFTGEVHRLTWNVGNRAAQSNDVDDLTYIEQQPAVFLSPGFFVYEGSTGNFTSWKTFGNWYVDLNKDRGYLLDKTKNTLDSLKAIYTGHELVRVIYQWMQRRTRYVSIQLGIGGYQAMPADLVDTKGYGDCKALTNYMHLLLKHVGIASNPILVRAGRKEEIFLPDFSSQQFNHVFLGVPFEKDTIFLECTSSSGPFNYLGDFTDDRYVLWVSDNASELIRSPVYSEEVNYQQTKAIVLVDSLGSTQVTLQTVSSGSFFDRDYMYFEAFTKGQLQEWKNEHFDYSDFTIEQYEVTRSKPELPVLERNIQMDVKSLVKRSGSKLLIPVNTLNPVLHYIYFDKFRQHGKAREAFRIEEEVNVVLPAENSIQSIPENVLLQSEFGRYELHFARTEVGYTIHRTILMKKGNYTGEQFSAYSEWLTQIRNAENRKIVVTAKT